MFDASTENGALRGVSRGYGLHGNVCSPQLAQRSECRKNCGSVVTVEVYVEQSTEARRYVTPKRMKLWVGQGYD